MSHTFKSARLPTLMASAAAIVVTASLLCTSSGPAMADQAQPCPRVAIVTFRGSGELQTVPIAKAGHLTLDGWEGSTIRRALRAYDSVAGPDGLTETPVEVIGTPWDASTRKGYEAIRIDPDLNDKSVPSAEENGTISAKVWAMQHSIGGSSVDTLAGVALYSHILAEIYRSSMTGFEEGGFQVSKNNGAKKKLGCNAPVYMSAGYSQGQMAARLLYSAHGRKGALKAVFGLGDPFQVGRESKSNQADAGLRGEGADGHGIFIEQKLEYGSADGTPPINYKDLMRIYGDETPKFFLCHDTDPMCDNTDMNSLAQSSSHSNYLKSRAEKASAAAWLQETILNLAKTPDALPPTVEEWEVEPGDGIWVAGSNARLQVTGPQALAWRTLTIDFVPYQDNQGSSIESAKAVPRARADADSFRVPSFMSPGTHVVHIPGDLQQGLYLLRVSTKFGSVTSTKPVHVIASDKPLDWRFASEQAYRATGDWECSSEPCDSE